MITTKDYQGETVEGVLTTFGTRTDHGVRIMSDVWADITYGCYLSPEGELREVAIYNSEFPGNGSTCEVDAAPEIKAAADAILAAGKLADVARDAARLADAARRELAQVAVKGRTVKVTAKRAKGHGNEGVVFWTGTDNWGKSRIGMKLTGTGEVFWTAASNCTPVNVDTSEADELAASAFEADKVAREASAKAKADAIAAVAATLEVSPF